MRIHPSAAGAIDGYMDNASGARRVLSSPIRSPRHSALRQGAQETIVLCPSATTADLHRAMPAWPVRSDVGPVISPGGRQGQAPWGAAVVDYERVRGERTARERRATPGI